MRGSNRRRLAALALLGLLGPRASTAGTVREPLRLSATALDERVRLEVLDLPRTEADRALRDAFRAIQEVAELADPDGERPGGLGELNRAAGRGPRPIATDLARVLERALEFCAWSRGAHGPLGGRLYALWGLRRAVPRRPALPALTAALPSARCNRLDLRPGIPEADLADGSRIDLWGFARGWAVDRAVEVMITHGAGNGWAEIGPVRRGFGAGPAGRGWPLTLPVLAGTTTPAGTVFLRDQALAVASGSGRTLEVPGETAAPFLDQRVGRPAGGTLAAIAATRLGIDAEGLAVTLFLLGNREGELRLGVLEPPPSVLWALGTGHGPPLFVSYHWSALARE